MPSDFDIAIVGSGFGGSLLAMICRQAGRSVALIERGRHPRFAIGESSTPLANLLLEEIAVEYDLPRLLPLAKWGTWQQTYPEIPCGLKRGFTFFHHQPDQPWIPNDRRSNELLVAASPKDAVADTHWHRASFDEFLVREAQNHGVEFLDETSLASVEFLPGSVRVSGKRRSAEVSLRTRLLIDATGPRGFLHHALNLEEGAFPRLPATQAIYSHFTGVARWDQLHDRSDGPLPPYPVDDAALHHLFPGGWIWVLRFNNGVTSAGAALEDSFAFRLPRSAPTATAAWEALLNRLPSVREQFRDAEPIFPLIHSPRLAFRTRKAAGEQWALLPSAAGFVDPLLSTGFPLTLLGVQRLGRIILESRTPESLRCALEEYERFTLEELDAAAELVSGLYVQFSDFEIFAALTMIYFAMANYSETARRLKRPELAHSFLLARDPAIREGLTKCVARSRSLSASERHSWFQEVRNYIEPFNIAGLARPSAANWYPVRLQDLFDTASKLDATREEIEQMLRRTGLWPAGDN